ncbi:MAG: hypothetical protein P8188_07215 [Gemmatimonadota bacterium]
MRTFTGFVLGAGLVSGIWLVAHRSDGTAVEPALEGPVVTTGLGQVVADFPWRGPGDREGRLADLLGRGPVVLALRDRSCPVSLRYSATLRAMEERFSDVGVRFVYLDATPSDVGDPNAAVLEDPVAPTGTLVRPLGDGFFRALRPVTTTEVFLLDAAGILRYRGAVDDRFGFDFSRQAPRSRHLEEAIVAVMANRAPPRPATFAPGCYLFYGDEIGPPTDEDSAVTWATTMRPIVRERCGACHRDGGTAPFQLTRYEDLASREEEIHRMVSLDRMPPWPASPHVGRWANDARLTVREKALFLHWLSAGMPRGSTERPPDERPPVAAWLHGEPDTVLSTAGPRTVSLGWIAGYETVYLPTRFDSDRWVTGVEIRPAEPGSVVEAVILLESPDTPDEERSRGLEGLFAGFAPGHNGGLFPEGTAKRIPAGAWLKLRIRYRNPALPTRQPVQLGLHFGPAPSGGELETRSVYTREFMIPAGASNHAVTAEYRFRESGHIHSFSPHMHLRGTAIRYTLEDPDGHEEILLDIPRYYFQFRPTYVPEAPIPVRAGSTLRVTGWYDNSEANPENPDPSAPASFGGGFSDDLLVGYFGFVPARAPDVPARTMIDEHDQVF